MKSSIKKIMDSSWFELLVRVSLGLLFFYSSIHKIADPAEFAKIIYGYSLYPLWMINISAILVPYFELIAGISLILGIYPRSGAFVINGLLLVFIVSISINLIRGHEFDCGCLSYGESKDAASNFQILVRDIISFLGGIYILYFRGSRFEFVKLPNKIVKKL